MCKTLHFKFIFIDDEKSIPHFKFAPLDYGYSGVYLQKWKMETQHCLLHWAFALKLVCQKLLKLSVTFNLCDLFSKFYHKIKFCNDTCTQNALWLNWWKTTSFSHFGGSNHYTLHWRRWVVVPAEMLSYKYWTISKVE